MRPVPCTLGLMCAATFITKSAALAGDCTVIEAASYRIDPRIFDHHGVATLKFDQSLIATRAAATALSSPVCAACAAQYEVKDGYSSSHVFDDCVGDDGDLIKKGQFVDTAKMWAYYRGECLGWGTLNRCKVRFSTLACTVRTTAPPYQKALPKLL
jgi:hypothetical protein